MNEAEDRLRRRYAEICKAGNLEQYAEELRRLAESIGGEEYFRAKARFFKTLSDPTRLKIIKIIAQREMCVCEIMAALNLTQPNASHHLNMLEREGIAKKRREGKWILYSLSSPKILHLMDAFV
ncbi:MAG: metalloregulator ArsR/SmtB family transcription factor [Nitrososphaerales archaeon]